MSRNYKTAFLFHEDYLKHNTGYGHPENEQRLISIVEHLKKTGLWKELVLLTPSKADVNWILKIHTLQHVEFVKEMCQTNRRVLDFGDTLVCRESYDIALLAVGGVLTAIDHVMHGTVRNAFCAVRPPGHHAEHNQAMGFCLFNNIAIAARYIQDKHQLEKIAIIDWDVHHGNGTQHSFYDDPTVFYISLHQFPHYPGTGNHSEKGQGKGKDYTLNFPMAAGSGEMEYLKIFKDKIQPVLNHFEPDFILISAGFDAHKNDPLSSIQLTENTYIQMTKILKQIAEDYCKGRIVSVLEGGYNLNELASSVEGHLKELML